MGTSILDKEARVWFNYGMTTTHQIGRTYKTQIIDNKTGQTLATSFDESITAERIQKLQIWSAEWAMSTLWDARTEIAEVAV